MRDGLKRYFGVLLSVAWPQSMLIQCASLLTGVTDVITSVTDVITELP